MKLSEGNKGRENTVTTTCKEPLVINRESEGRTWCSVVMVIGKRALFQAQRHRGTEAQMHRGPEAQRHRGTEAQRHTPAE